MPQVRQWMSQSLFHLLEVGEVFVWDYGDGIYTGEHIWNIFTVVIKGQRLTLKANLQDFSWKSLKSRYKLWNGHNMNMGRVGLIKSQGLLQPQP
jgi:hypothetical protein